MAANVVTNGTGSTLLVPALRLPALPDAAAPAPAAQQDAHVPLPAYGEDYDVSMDLTAELADIIDVSEEEARLRAQAWRFEQTFEARAEQHFGWSSTSGTWPSERGRRLERTVRRSRVRSRLWWRPGSAPDSARGVRRLSCASRHGDAGGHSRSR